MKKNKTFLISLFALVIMFGGIVACNTTEEPEVVEDTDVEVVTPEVEPETEVEVEEDEELEDLDQKIEDPELQDPNVKFDENLEISD